MKKVVSLIYVIITLVIVTFQQSNAVITYENKKADSINKIKKHPTSLVLSINYLVDKAECKLTTDLEGMTYVYVIDDEGKVWGRMSLNLVKGENTFVVDASKFPNDKKYAVLAVHISSRENAIEYFNN